MSSSGASGAAAGAAGTAGGATGAGAVDPTVASSMLNKASAAVASGPTAPVIDTAPTVVVTDSASSALQPLGSDELLTSLYPALDPDSWLHIIPMWFQTGLEWIHSHTGLPWVGSIMLTILAARTMMLPLHIMQAKASAGGIAAQPELFKLQQAHAAVAAQYAQIGQVLPLKLKLEQDAAVAALNSKYGANYKILKMMGPGIMSMPLFISFFVALRAMGHVDPTFCTGGVLWFQNLAELDSTYALPVINACVIAATAWVNSRFVVAQQTTLTRFMTKFMYVMAVLSLPFSALNMPAGVIVYWITNGLILMAQGFVLRNKTVMRVLGIRERPKDLPKSSQTQFVESTLTPEQRAEREKIRFFQMKREQRNAQRGGVQHAAAAATAAAPAAAAAAAPSAPTAPLNPFLAAPSTATDVSRLRQSLRYSSTGLGALRLLNTPDPETQPATAAAGADSTAAGAAAASSAQAVRSPAGAPVVPAKAPAASQQQQQNKARRGGRR